MAKRKKARTPAQKAATKRMLAANKRLRGNPTARKPKAKVKKATVKKTTTGRRQVTRKKGQSLTAGARKFVDRANKSINKAPKGKVVTRQYKSGKYGKIFRENPANRGKAIMAAAGGFALGIVGADILDRYIATRAPADTTAALMGQDAKNAINAKPDGMRIFAQAAGTGVSAVGAYMLRKKSMVGTYLLGGLAAAFAAKALGMVVKGHLMPALMPAKGSDSDWVKRMAYGDLAGPRGYMGAPRPFQRKPTRIGPQATGSVGSYGCTRVPVNAGSYMTPEPGRGPNCSPWPFQMGSQGSDCIDRVGKGPTGTKPRPNFSQTKVPPSPRTPTTRTPTTRTPTLKMPDDFKRVPTDDSEVERPDGTYVPPSSERRVVKNPPQMRFVPSTPDEGIPAPSMRFTVPGRFNPLRRNVSVHEYVKKVPQVY